MPESEGRASAEEDLLVVEILKEIGLPSVPLAREIARLRRREAALENVVKYVRETKRIAEGSPGWAGEVWLNGTDEGCMCRDALIELEVGEVE